MSEDNPDVGEYRNVYIFLRNDINNKTHPNKLISALTLQYPSADVIITNLWLGSGEPQGWTAGNMIGQFMTTEEWRDLAVTWTSGLWVPKTNHPLYFLPEWGPRFYVDLDFIVHAWPSREDRRANIVHFTTGRSFQAKTWSEKS